MLHQPNLSFKDEWRAIRLWLIPVPLIGLGLYFSGWSYDYGPWVLVGTGLLELGLLFNLALARWSRHGRNTQVIWWGATTTYMLGVLVTIAASGGLRSPAAVAWAMFPLRMLRADGSRRFYIAFSVAEVALYLIVCGLNTPQFSWNLLILHGVFLSGMAWLQIRVWGILQRLKVQNQNLVMSLQRQNDELVRANKAKTLFLSQVSHELRTPLSVVTSYTQMLQEGLRGALSPAVQGDLQQINSSAQQLSYMVDDLLTLNRSEMGHLTVTLVPIDLSKLLQDLVMAVAPAALEKGVAMRTSLEPDCVVPGDPIRLKQVFFNLLSNALKFTDSGVVWVECSTDGGRVEIRVLDSGIGIPPDVMSQLFTPFTTSSVSRQRGGVGLGLAIVKRLLDLHHGEILVRSQPGEGTEVTVLLPSYDWDAEESGA